MKTIHKLTLPRSGAATYSLNASFQPLHIEMQKGVITLWFKTNTECISKEKDVVFHVYGTGWEMEDVTLKYLGTAIDDADRFVWHVFQEV